MIRLICFMVSISITLNAFAQLKPNFKTQTTTTKSEAREPGSIKQLNVAIPEAAQVFGEEIIFKPISNFQKPQLSPPNFKAEFSGLTGMPFVIEGEMAISPLRSVDAQVSDYMDAVLGQFQLPLTTKELQVISTESDDLGIEHIRLKQVWNGVPIYGAEAILHKKNDRFFLFNGRILPSPVLKDALPNLTPEDAAQKAVNHSNQSTPFIKLSSTEKEWIGGEQVNSELVIYYKDGKPGSERLAWQVTLVANLSTRLTYFIEAKTGEILHHRNELCKLIPKAKTNWHESITKDFIAESKTSETLLADGPATAMATDLFGQQRLIHTYQKSGTYFMLDASRTMFKNTQSVMPDAPVGTIWTIDARNKSPENSDFQASHIASLNNSWNDPKSVSAHYHGAKAYEYFNNTFARNSINGRGGNIISLINIVESDGSQMDNAFWNGAAMFYGNGNQAFKAPLCKALDVAGHEMAHGVIQATSNLEYYGESGALNESFADVFGAMIDRDDWKMGEDIVNTAVFPTGALRDLSNPHNGGASLNDPGYQPAHFSERYKGSEDNGGVHINSGIPNKAFQLFADNAVVGKSKAEQVYYRALTRYLVKSSQFIDCRIAVIQSANDLYGSAVANAAAAAFDAVGILSGTGSQAPTDVATNPGNDYILMSDDDFSALYIFTPAGKEVANPLVSIAPASKPSITDDGSVVVFIAKDETMRAITIDWVNGQVKNQTIQNEPIWRNVAISKDGRKIAALKSDLKNELLIYSFDTQKWSTFKLYNPTTGQGGPTTGDVLYADVLEWDFSGDWIMYDALNKIKITAGKNIEYWDINFVRVWNKSIKNAGDGFISKLFNGLPNDVSIANPTFSKNSDYIIAFDYIDDFEEDYYLLSANLESGDVGTIFQNTDLSWPSFSADDKRLVFDAEDNLGKPVLAFISLGNDKISPSGNASIFIANGRWGVWFANGNRVIVNVDEPAQAQEASIFPNPVTDILNVLLYSKGQAEVKHTITDLMGRHILNGINPITNGANTFKIPVSELSSGLYFLRLDAGNEVKTYKFLVD